MNNFDVAVIGGGPAAMAAAISAKEHGAKSVIILERANRLGGILNQCIHNGFGLHYFKEELTGPEYARRFEEKIKGSDITVKLNTAVLKVLPDRAVNAINDTDGMFTVNARAVVLAMGCRERPCGALNIPGARPAGIISAGTAQKFVNMDGYMPGKEIVILGSGDIGLIMARRMTLEGATVKVVCELMPYSGGLKRNIVQCLDDFGIPLLLSHTVVNIHGNERVTGVTIAAVDGNLQPISGSEQFTPCDTLMLSVGLIPENELTRDLGAELDSITGGALVNHNMQTSVNGIFSCGNVLHVHDLVDFVTEESNRAGMSAAKFALGGADGKMRSIDVNPGLGVRYTVPQRIDLPTADESIRLFFRTDKIYQNMRITVRADGEIIKQQKKARLSPGEMESISIGTQSLYTVKILTLELEDANGRN